jgi:hypothetical protein
MSQFKTIIGLSVINRAQQGDKDSPVENWEIARRVGTIEP